jgi:hypothetical protein
MLYRLKTIKLTSLQLRIQELLKFLKVLFLQMRSLSTRTEATQGQDQKG